RNIIRCLTERVIKICSPDCLEEELKFLGRTFPQNGYPEMFVLKTMEGYGSPNTMFCWEKAYLQNVSIQRFVLKTMEAVKPKPTEFSVRKKPVYMRLPFKGGLVAESITRRLRNSVDTTYLAANLYKLPRSTTSFCVYSFVCSCQASHVGGTTGH
ncbi:hypothetical protein T265_14900, partial [Opisthorchis viverrini]